MASLIRLATPPGRRGMFGVASKLRAGWGVCINEFVRLKAPAPLGAGLRRKNCAVGRPTHDPLKGNAP